METDFATWIVNHWELIVAAGVILDAVSGIIPDRFLPYIGLIRRLVLALKKSGTSKFLVVLVIPILMACAVITTSKVCTNIPEGEYSVICQMAEKAGTTPENVANIIKIADLLLLEETHTAEQAWTFLHEIKDASATAQALDGATWDQFIGYVSVKFMQLPPKVRAALEIVKTLQGVDMSDVPVKVLSGYDWGMVDAAIDDHIDIIAPFVPFDDVRFVPFDEVRMLGNLNLAP